MLKLVRNALGAKKQIQDKENKIIKWQFIEDLVMLQEIKGLRGCQ